MKIIISENSCSWSQSHQAPTMINYGIDLGDRSYEIFIRSPDLQPQPGLEAALPLVLLAAMRLRRPIHVQGALSYTFLDGVKNFMSFYQTNYQHFSAVEITADSYYKAGGNNNQRKAAFFSGGVDSFFTLMKARQELTDLICIYGFDMSLKDTARWEKVRKMGGAVSTGVGVHFIEVESNMGKIIKDFGSWLQHGHGLALASVARALGGAIGEVRIPGTFSLSEQKPWGSSASTDPLFSDERVMIVHDACGASRADKVVALANEPLALEYLRVCGGRPLDGMYNCCRCEKCLRTMVSLYAVGVLDKAVAFPLPLSPELVAKVLLERPGLRSYTLENIALLKKMRPDDEQMIRALERQMRRPVWVSRFRLKMHKKIRHIREKLGKLTESSMLP